MPSPASALAELLRALSRVLLRIGARWYVFGAQAVLVWGRPRFTADIDVTVRLDPEAPERLVAEMDGAGFALRVDPADNFVARTRVLPFVHTSTGWLLDLVLAGPGLEERFLERAVTIDLGAGVLVPVISAEDLIVTKILASRSKDMDDVRGILLERLETLDLASIRDTLRLLQDALGVSDLMPALEAELLQAQKRRRKP